MPDRAKWEERAVTTALDIKELMDEIIYEIDRDEFVNNIGPAVMAKAADLLEALALVRAERNEVLA